MKLVHVIPIAKGFRKESLSYFSNKNIKSGSIVFVPLRKRVVPSIAIKTEEISNVKLRLRSSQYSIKKVERHTTTKLLIPEFMGAVMEVSKYFASSVGEVLHRVIPKIILDNIENIPQHSNVKNINRELVAEKLILQADESTRLLQYKNLVREAFARNSSVYICVPTIKDAGRIESKINKGIEKYVSVLHSEIPKAKLLDQIKSNIKEKHPILIIGTGLFLSIPRSDIKTIIIEKEGSSAYKTIARPFIDFRILATYYAEKLDARLIFADMPIRVETEWYYRHGKYDELMTKKSLITTDTKQMVIDMRSKNGEKKFKILSDELKNIIVNTEKTKEKIFLLNARRGIAPTTVCEDCGNTVRCNKCDSLVVLHKNATENVFICHKCGETRSAKEKCFNCDSWRLKALGIGIERVVEELSGKFEGRKVFVVDRDTTKTHKQIQKVIKNFNDTEGAILVGTEMAIQYVKSVAYSAIVSIDSLLLLPDIYAYERVFSILFNMRNITQKTFILQTRQPELSVIEHAQSGNLQKFFTEEIEKRKQFNYPPFSVLIKITSIGPKIKISQEMKGLEKYFSDYDFKIYPIFDSLGAKRFALSGFIKVLYKDWVDEKLLMKLRKLPMNISVNVSP